MTDAPRPGPPVPGPPPSGDAADVREAAALTESLAGLEERPVDDLDGTFEVASALHDRLQDRLRDLGSS